MPRQIKLSRRETLHYTAASISAVGIGASLTPRMAYANALGANDRIRVRVIGTGVCGKYLIGNLPESARVTAICDCATSRMADTLDPQKPFTEIDVPPLTATGF